MITVRPIDRMVDGSDSCNECPYDGEKAIFKIEVANFGLRLCAKHASELAEKMYKTALEYHENHH